MLSVGGGNHHSTTSHQPSPPITLSQDLSLPALQSQHPAGEKGFQLLRYPSTRYLASRYHIKISYHYPGFLFYNHNLPVWFYFNGRFFPSGFDQFQFFFPFLAELLLLLLLTLAHGLKTQDLKQELVSKKYGLKIVFDFEISFPFSKFSGTLSIVGVLR